MNKEKILNKINDIFLYDISLCCDTFDAENCDKSSLLSDQHFQNCINTAVITMISSQKNVKTYFSND